MYASFDIDLITVHKTEITNKKKTNTKSTEATKAKEDNCC